MCFSQAMSLGLSVLGLVTASFAYRCIHPKLGMGAFYFTLMEILQFTQYFVVDGGDGVQCKTFANQFLTWLGYLHIAFQPWITHYMVGALMRNKVSLKINEYTLRICLVGGVWFLSRNGLWLLGLGNPSFNKSTGGVQRSYDWIPDSGAGLCTIQGKYHIGWSVPVHQHTYLVPSTSIHAFLMFAPFLCCGKRFLDPIYMCYGAFLLFTGPLLSMFLIAPDEPGNPTALNEQAAIWCFMSIGQIVCMVCAAIVLKNVKGLDSNDKDSAKDE